MGSRAVTFPQGCAIMVVEDEFFQADDLAIAFSEAGARLVGPFGTVEAALSALAGGARVDAAILDVNLRGVAVTPVAEALSARGIPFLFATGYDRDMLPPAWRGAPIYQKPFDTDALIEAAARLCRGQGGRPAAGQPPRKVS